MRRASDTNDTAATILDAAEELFSQRGFRAVSLREIARAAGVAVSSVAYHFGDKPGVLQAIYDHHSQPMNARRLELLGEALRIADPSARLKAIIRAYLLPGFCVVSEGSAGGGARFTRMRAVVSSEGDPDSRGVIADTFDPVAQRMIDAMLDCVPGVARIEVVWRQHFMLGSMFYTLTNPGRIHRLSGGTASGLDHDEAIAQITAMIHDSLFALHRQTAGAEAHS